MKDVSSDKSDLNSLRPDRDLTGEEYGDDLFRWPAHNTSPHISLHDLPYHRTINCGKTLQQNNDRHELGQIRFELVTYTETLTGI